MNKLLTLFAFLFLGNLSFGQTYYSQGSGDPDVFSNWDTDRNGGGSQPTTFRGTDDVFVIQNGHTMTTTNATGGATINGWQVVGTDSKLQIEAGGTLVADYEVDIYRSSGTFQIDDGGTYVHNNSSKSIFDGSESFASNSTFEYQEVSSSTENITYGNLIFNYDTGGNTRFDAGNTGTITINGNLEIKQTSNSNSDEIRCATGSATGVTLDIGGDFLMTNGAFDFYSTSGGSGGTINVTGDFLLTGGTWDNAGSDNLTINFLESDQESDFSMNGVSASGFTTNDIQWEIKANETLNLLSNWSAANDRAFIVNGQINFGSYYVEGGGSSGGEFQANATATLGIGSSDGIDNSSSNGNIRYLIGDRDIDLDCTIIYNGTSAQLMGDGLDDIGELTGSIQIANSTAAVEPSEDLNVGDGFALVVDENAILDIDGGLNITRSAGSTASLTINGRVICRDADGFSASTTSGDQSIRAFTSCAFGINGTVEYAHTQVQTITTQFSYNHLDISNSSPSNAFSGTLDVNGNLSLSNGSHLELGTHTLELAGDLTIASNSELEEGTGKVELDGAAQSLDANGNILDFYELTVKGTDRKIAEDAIDIQTSGQLTITSGTLDMNGHALDAFLGSGVGSKRTLNMSGGTLILSHSSTDQQPHFDNLNLTGGTIELSATGDQVLHGSETYYDLRFAGSGTKTISSATSDIDGTVYVSGSCSLDVDNSSFGDANTNLTMSGGSFLVSGSGTKPDIGGTYSLSGGSIEFKGTSNISVRSPLTYNDVIISAENASGSSGNYTLNNGATFTVTNNGAFSVSNQRMLSSGNASLVVNGSFLTSNNNGFSGTNGNESIDENSINITLGSSSTIEYNSGSGTQKISDRDDYANLKLSGGASKDFGTSSSPTIKGDLSIAGGSLSSVPSSFVFDNSSSQNIAGTNYSTANITLSGGGDKVLSGDATINGTVTFSNGHILCGDHDLTLGSSANTSSANSNSYVRTNGTGRVLKTISSGSTYNIPLGENPYLPVSISCASCTNAEFAFGVKDVVYEDPTDRASSQTFAQAGKSNYVNKTWDVTPQSSLSSNVTFEIEWNSADQVPSPGSNNTANSLAIGYWEDNGSTSQWNSGTVSNAGVNGSTYTISRTLTGMNTNRYYMGVGGSSTPLPVDLAYFTTECADNSVQIKWQTQSESNCDYFKLEGKSGSNIRTLQEIPGAGTSIVPIDYEVEISSPEFDFIRLVQYDFDGTSHYYHWKQIGCEQNVQISISNGILRLPSRSGFRLFNTNGQLINEGSNQSFIHMNHLPTGMYILEHGGKRQLISK